MLPALNPLVRRANVGRLATGRRAAFDEAD